MTKVILYIAASVDGYIAEKNGGLDWLNSYQNESEDYGYQNFLQTIGACFMGRNTYEIALSLDGGIDPKLSTYVTTHSPTPSDRSNVYFISGANLKEVLHIIRSKTEKDIWLVGGGKRVQSFLKEHLIDEIILSTIPILLGDGIPLFGVQDQHQKLSVRSSKCYSDGIVQTQYIVQDSNAQSL